MNVTATTIPEVLLVDLDVFTDDRGSFVERYHAERFAKWGLPTDFRQDNHSRSHRGVLRGLHYQLRHAQGKLVSCVRGSVFDVAVDIRVGSPTFARWVGTTLSEDKPQLMWIPQGFAHGFCALSDLAEVEYKCTDFYVPADEHGILWSDPEIGVNWPVASPLVSRRDRHLPKLRAAELPLFSAPAESLTAQ